MSLSHDEQLMRLARAVNRQEVKARDLRRMLKEVTKDLRAKRKELKAYAQSVSDGSLPAWNERAPRFRTLGE